MTDDKITETREWFAANARACIEDAVSGQTRVNDLTAYVASREADIANIMAGAWDHTFTFRQHATFLRTGRCLPLLPPAVSRPPRSR